MSLIAETSNPLLEEALHAKLQRRGQGPAAAVAGAGELGQLLPVAVRLGLLQNTLRPRLRDPQLVLLAADHGLAVEGVHTVQTQPTETQVAEALAGRLPAALLARRMGLSLLVVDAGVAKPLPAHEGLMQRKIAHGTRNARVSAAMSLEQAHAGIRAGMEIGHALPGNVLGCGALGVGSHEAAALLLARLTDTPVMELLASSPEMNPDLLDPLLGVAHAILGRHRDVHDPIEALAAFGGFETALMVGLMLVAASKRHLVLVDGITACAALMVASRISPPVTDYGVFCRSHSHHGLDRAMALFQASAMVDLSLATTDGAGACLTWPLLRAATALLGDTARHDSGDLTPPPADDDAGPDALTRLPDPG